MLIAPRKSSGGKPAIAVCPGGGVSDETIRSCTFKFDFVRLRNRKLLCPSCSSKLSPVELPSCASNGPKYRLNVLERIQNPSPRVTFVVVRSKTCFGLSLINPP